MEQKFRRLDRKSLAALLLVIIRIIKADSRIDADEIEQLSLLEKQYGFDRTFMAEASQLTLAEALQRLSELDKPMREQIMKSLTELANMDRVLERHEALLLLAVRYCLIARKEHCHVVSSQQKHHGDNADTYILYFENETDPVRHEQFNRDWELQKLLLQQSGFSLFYVEHIIADLCQQDEGMVRKLLGYLAPTMSDGQIEQLYARMSHMDTATFCREILIKSMELSQLRHSGPSLLINLGNSDYLHITLQQKTLDHLRIFLTDFNQLVSPTASAIRTTANSQGGQFSYYSYYRDFFNLLVQAEPKESRMVIWPKKSEFTFPDASRTLRLNQQEAALYSLILTYTYKYNKKGLPLSYTKDRERIKALYRSIYSRKKFIDDDDVIFPDNLAPIRAKIEKKMRTQLDGLDNLEDFIPHNENREGYYRIVAPVKMVCVKPDIRLNEVNIADWDW